MNRKSNNSSVANCEKRTRQNELKRNKRRQDVLGACYKRMKTSANASQMENAYSSNSEPCSIYSTRYIADRENGQKMRIISRIVDEQDFAISDDEMIEEECFDCTLFDENTITSRIQNIESNFNKQRHPTIKRVDNIEWNDSEEQFPESTLFYNNESKFYMSSDEHDYLSTYRFQKANEAHNLNSSSFSNNEMNTKRQPFEHSGSSYSRFVPASVQLKNQCLKSSYCFTENPSVQKFGLNSKEFKQIYRAQRDQISKTIQLDITYIFCCLKYTIMISKAFCACLSKLLIKHIDCTCIIIRDQAESLNS